jgi:hypothetical protein
MYVPARFTMTVAGWYDAQLPRQYTASKSKNNDRRLVALFLKRLIFIFPVPYCALP